MLRWIRDAVWERAGSRCEARVGDVRCGRAVSRADWTGHIHHLVYRGHGRELLADLELRCLACHGAEHPEREFLDRAEQEARRSAREARRIRPDGGRWGR